MAVIHDLGSYLEVLEAAGQLVRIRRPVDLKYEMADVATALEQQGGPAPLFESVTGSAWPLFCSSVATAERVALALGCEKGQIMEVMSRAIDPANAVAPVEVAEAGWKAHVVRGSEVDIGLLPVPTHARGDGGPFITGGVAVTRDPHTGRGNLSYNRMHVKGPRRLGFTINQWRHARENLDTYAARGEAMPVAVAIGLDPALNIAAGVRYDGDELCIAGAIRGTGVKVTRGVTVDLLIPAEAQIVVEGRVLPGVLEPEGPLAEFHGYYGSVWPSPVFEPTAICWRDHPMYQTIIPGWREHVNLGGSLPREATLLNFVRHVSKKVTGLHLAPWGNGFVAIVALAKDNPGEPKNVAMAAFTGHVNVRWCIVVDPDVDIYSPADVLWALTNRVDWNKDIFLVPGAVGHEMDPTSDKRGIQTKIGVDATAEKGRREVQPRVQYRPVNLNDYLSGLSGRG